MINKKTRRHSGRYTPRLHSKIPFNEMIEDCLEPQENYDDWLEQRDGSRDCGYLEWKERDKKKRKRSRKNRKRHPYKLGGRR